MECEHLQEQLDEVELLRSMYPDSELILEAPGVITCVKEYMAEKTTEKPQQIAFTIRLPLQLDKSCHEVFLWTSLPAAYPSVLPEMFVRSSVLSRHQQGLLNQQFSQFLRDQFISEPCVMTAIMWLQEHLPAYCDDTVEDNSNTNENNHKSKYSGLSRLWIYSHHIYRKELLKKIPESAAQLNLTGFVLPGKPGIICVEGIKEHCDEYWQTLKYPNWKHISCKHRQDKELNEQQTIDVQVQQFRIFETFEELAFEAHGDYGLRNDYHMDLGQFRKYLISCNCEFMFQIFFGLEGK